MHAVSSVTVVPDGAFDVAASLGAVTAYFNKLAAIGLLEAVEAVDLSATQIRVLHHLDEGDSALTMRQAAESVGMPVATISRTVDGLVRRDYVCRREDDTDRRVKRVRITSQGRLAIRQFESVNRDAVDRFVRSLPRALAERLSAALHTLVERPEIAACRPPSASQTAAANPASLDK